MKRQLCLALAMLLLGTACAAPVYLQPSSLAYYFNITVEIEDTFIPDKIFTETIAICKERGTDSSAIEREMLAKSKNGGALYTKDNWLDYALPYLELFGSGEAQKFLEEYRGKTVEFHYDGAGGFVYS